MSRIAKDWDDKHLEGPPPQLMGQLFHRFEAQSFRPSALLHAARLGVEREPDRHVVNWHDNISCDGFKGQ
jgi:hypothetical protein